MTKIFRGRDTDGQWHIGLFSADIDGYFIYDAWSSDHPKNYPVDISTVALVAVVKNNRAWRRLTPLEKEQILSGETFKPVDLSLDTIAPFWLYKAKDFDGKIHVGTIIKEPKRTWLYAIFEQGCKYILVDSATVEKYKFVDTGKTVFSNSEV